MTHKEYNLTEKEFYRLLEDLKAGNIKDTELEIDTEYFYEEVRYKIGDKETVLLCEALKKNPHIKKVTLHNQHVADIGAEALARVGTIEELIIDYNKIGPVGAIALAKSNLKVLNLDVNYLVEYQDDLSDEEYKYHDDTEIEKMIKAFIKNKTIVDLNLGNADIPEKILAQLINDNNTIISLSVYCSSNSDEALRHIGNNKAIRELFLPRNGITDVGAKYLAENTRLKTLVLHTNEITDVGAKILSTHSSLKHLVLIKNNLTIKGMKYFLDSKLDTIKIDYNKEASKQEISIFYEEFKQMLKSREEVLQVRENETYDYDLVGDINNSDI